MLPRFNALSSLAPRYLAPRCLARRSLAMSVNAPTALVPIVRLYMYLKPPEFLILVAKWLYCAGRRLGGD